jgi:ABC-2 type transport system ATP-binding protein
VAVNRLNLTVYVKQIHGFLGPNGAGKTTTIKMLVGLLTPDSGSLKILGMDAAGDKPKIRQRIGYMPELPKFPKHLTGEELLDVYGRMYGIGVTLAYLAVFLFLRWYAFRCAQIIEST